MCYTGPSNEKGAFSMGRTSNKREEILRFLTQFVAENGYAPSVREICAAVGLQSTATVHYHLGALREAGLIEMDDMKKRAITLPDAHRADRIPVVGVVTAGVPILAVENIEGYIPWEGEAGCFALRVRGDSMIGAGILDGDKVVVRPQQTATNGEIVVALLEDSATVKRFQKTGKQVWLLPENPAYQPIDGNEAQILGKVKAVIREEIDKRGCKIPFDVASNPEFLKEGAAIKDFMSPDRVVVGIESERARKLMTRLYRPFLINNFRVLFMDIPSAEMTKYAANAMLATRISFMNEIANLCDLVGANVEMVRKGIGSDARIGSKFLYPGCGYGGSCFPKDVKALARTAQEHGYTMQVIEAVERVNEGQKSILFGKLQRALGDLHGKTIAIWGLAFKPETDDMREAPALVVIDLLRKAGATVRVYDPVAMEEARRRIGDEGVHYAGSMYEAAKGADAIALVTEWKQFRMPDWPQLLTLMRDNILVDGRNIFDKEEVLNAGLRYYGIGK